MTQMRRAPRKDTRARALEGTEFPVLGFATLRWDRLQFCCNVCCRPSTSPLRTDTRVLMDGVTQMRRAPRKDTRARALGNEPLPKQFASVHLSNLHMWRNVCCRLDKYARRTCTTVPNGMTRPYRASLRGTRALEGTEFPVLEFATLLCHSLQFCCNVCCRPSTSPLHTHTRVLNGMTHQRRAPRKDTRALGNESLPKQFASVHLRNLHMWRNVCCRLDKYARRTCTTVPDGMARCYR